MGSVALFQTRVRVLMSCEILFLWIMNLSQVFRYSTCIQETNMADQTCVIILKLLLDSYAWGIAKGIQFPCTGFYNGAKWSTISFILLIVRSAEHLLCKVKSMLLTCLFRRSHGGWILWGFFSVFRLAAFIVCRTKREAVPRPRMSFGYFKICAIRRHMLGLALYWFGR